MKRFFDWLNAPAYNNLIETEKSESEKIEERRKQFRIVKHEERNGKTQFIIEKLANGKWETAKYLCYHQMGSDWFSESYPFYEQAIDRVEHLVDPNYSKPTITVM